MEALALEGRRPTRVTDELAWELVRDEWELLLTIGSGPTSAYAVATALDIDVASAGHRIGLLAEHGLVRTLGDGFGLVSAFYERREGMSSYIRDLVLRRLDATGPAPLASQVKRVASPAQLVALLERAEEILYPEVVDAANRPESDRSERFSVFFAAAAGNGEQVGDEPTLRAVPLSGETEARTGLNEFLRVLRAAAAERHHNPDTDSAYLWIAEMRTDPEVAVEISELFETFLGTIADGDGPGAVGFAVVPSMARQTPRRVLGDL